jgi:hypothetical protein
VRFLGCLWATVPQDAAGFAIELIAADKGADLVIRW